MTLEIEEIKRAMNIVNKQITGRLLSKNKMKVKLGLDAIQDMWALHEDGNIIICGPMDEEINPKYPKWIVFESDSNQFRIIAEANPYAPEMAFFLIEVWKGMKTDPDTSLEQHVEQSLSLIEQRWKLNGEPLNRKTQRGLIGELEAIRHVHPIKGLEAVDAWDHTSHAKHDLSGVGWAVEAKSRSPDSNMVSISSLDQLKWSDTVKLVLSVTSVKSDKDGLLFPDYVDSRHEELKSIDPDAASVLLIKLQSCGYNEATRHRFKSRWVIPELEDTVFFKINQDSPTNWWSWQVEPSRPKEIKVHQYKLDLSTGTFNEEPLQSLLD